MVYTTSRVVEENVDILGSAPSTVQMPLFNTTLESAIFVGSLLEEAYTDFMSEIGMHELSVYESTGAEILYEDGEGQETEEKVAFKDKVAGFFKKAWEAIKKMFEEAIKWFQEKIKAAKSKKMDKIKAAWNAKKGQIKDDKTFGTSRFTCPTLIKKGSSGFVNSAKLFIDAGKAAANKLADGSESNVLDAFKNSSVSGIADVLRNANSPKDFKFAFYKLYNIPEKGTPVDKKWVDEHLDDLAAIVIQGKDTSEIKAIYNKLKGEVNALAKEVRSGKTDVVKAKAKAIVQVLGVVSAADGALIDIMKARYVEANNIVTSIAMAAKLSTAKKDEKAAAPAVSAEDATDESAIISAIETAFDW